MSGGGNLEPTLALQFQLATQNEDFLACTYNKRRHHILTADAAHLKLWSLRKELKRVDLPSDDGKRFARVTRLLYDEVNDTYVACFGTRHTVKTQRVKGRIVHKWKEYPAEKQPVGTVSSLLFLLWGRGPRVGSLG